MSNFAKSFEDLTGRRYGRILVVKQVERPDGKPSGRYWLCCCDCGKEQIKPTRLVGVYQSCACITKTHGMSSTREYRIWSTMRKRCYYKKQKYYENYGGRGIVVCDRWKESFEAFLEDMGRAPSEKHELDRINSNGNYEPGNVRWATRTENMRNRRNNVIVEVNGVKMTSAEASSLTGVKRQTIQYRVKRGWPTEKTAMP